MTFENDMPGEIEGVAELPKELEPSSGLENRIVGELIECGVLRQQRQLVIELTHWRLAGVVAACLALMVGGFVMGLLSSAQRSMVGPNEQASNGFALAASVQGAGGEYLAALEDFTYFSSALAEDEASMGREVAIATLISATSAIRQMMSQDDVLRQLLPAILLPDAGRAPGTSALRTVRF